MCICICLDLLRYKWNKCFFYFVFLLWIFLLSVHITLLVQYFQFKNPTHKDDNCNFDFSSYVILYQIFTITCSLGFAFTIMWFSMFVCNYRNNIYYHPYENYLYENSYNVNKQIKIESWSLSVLSIISLSLNIEVSKHSNCQNKDLIFLTNISKLYIPFFWNFVELIFKLLLILLFYIFENNERILRTLGLPRMNEENNVQMNENNLHEIELERNVNQNEIIIDIEQIFIESNECCICYEKDFQITSCGHPICEDCDKNLRIVANNHNQRNKQCPICRESYNYLININSYREHKRDEAKKVVNNIMENIINKATYKIK